MSDQGLAVRNPSPSISTFKRRVFPSLYPTYPLHKAFEWNIASSRLARALSVNYLPGSHQLPLAVARKFENCIVVVKRLVAVAHSEIGN